jgi:hypothetical protein
VAIDGQDQAPVVTVHVGHWIWELVFMAPLILIGIGLVVAEIMERRNPGRYEREAEEQAERELDEILRS